MTTKLNPVQLHLLRLFAHDLNPNELAGSKQLLSDYFIRKADEEMAQLQEQKLITQVDLDALLSTHLRTPYNPQ